MLESRPLSQSDSGQLDQVPHARRDDDRLLVRVAGLVVALHLLHHELGVAQQRVLGEAVEVEAGGRNRRLRGGRRGGHTLATRQLLEGRRSAAAVTSILLRRSS